MTDGHAQGGAWSDAAEEQTAYSREDCFCPRGTLSKAVNDGRKGCAFGPWTIRSTGMTLWPTPTEY